MRNKAYRNHKQRAKLIHRIKYWMLNTTIWDNEGNKIDHPTITDCLKSEQSHIYKSTGTPCSCAMCAHYKYNRGKFKRETQFLLKEYERGQSPLFLCE